MSSLKTRTFTEVEVGDVLPELAIEMTSTLIIAGALASNDYTPVHHDKQAAVAQGLPDVIMNVLTTNGWVSRYVTDWAGPNAEIKKLGVKLGAPNVPGDTMKLTGKVLQKDEEQSVVDIEVVGKNSWGAHATASVSVALPRGA
ncbi:MAG: MaoC family dehydratase [Deltaproteobacteria bacterium]|jgi:acyl dehydratase|nr:MaoC family dehydratase [Deltaproteobacteria bacterium]MBW2375610.1 MaoC family dehydratase [Deltaproteobacteria bacterium]